MNGWELFRVKFRDKILLLNSPQLESLLGYQVHIPRNLNDIKKREELIKLIKEKLVKLGALSVIFVSVLNFTNVADYAIQKGGKHLVTDFNSSNMESSQLTLLFNKYLDKNPNLNEEEKEVIKEGYSNYFKDWGYLYDEDSFTQILVQAMTMKRVVADFKVPWASGDYNPLTKTIKTEDESLNTLFHEAVHGLSDHGLSLGTANPFGYCMNEGIAESITKQYYIRSDSGVYFSPRRYAMLMERLIGKEAMMKSQISGGIDYIIDSCCAISSNVKRSDVIKLIAMMDISLFVRDYQVIKSINLPADFDSAFDELYNKIFNEKYRKNTEDDFFTNLIINNKLHGFTVNFIGDYYITTIRDVNYRIPATDINKVNQDNLSNYIYTDYYYSCYETLLMLIMSKEDATNFVSVPYEKRDKFPQEIMNNKFFNDEEAMNKYFVNDLIINRSEEAIKRYIEMYFETKTSENLDPGTFAADIKYDIDAMNFFLTEKNDIENEKLKELVKTEIDRKLTNEEYLEVAYYYYQTDLKWESKNYWAPENNKLAATYQVFYDLKPQLYTNKNGWYFIINLPPDCKLYSGSYNKGNGSEEEKISFYDGVKEEYGYRLSDFIKNTPNPEEYYVILDGYGQPTLNPDDFKLEAYKEYTYIIGQQPTL